MSSGMEVMGVGLKAVSTRDGGCLGESGDIWRAYLKSKSAEDCDERKRCGPRGPSTGLTSPKPKSKLKFS